MNKLSKEQIAKKAELHGKLKDAHQKLSDAVTETNANLSSKFEDIKGNLQEDDLEEYIQKYNDARTEGATDIERLQQEFNEILTEEVHPFMEELATEMRDYFDTKSEKWQEGEAGEKYTAWVEAWETVYDEIDFELPENDLELKELIGVSIDDFEPNEIDDPEDCMLEEFEQLPNAPGAD